MRTLPSTAAALALLAGCAELQKVASSALDRPTLALRSATVKTLDLEGATLAFDLEIRNPNAIGAELARLGWALDVEGKRVVDGAVPGGLRIPANGVAPLTVPVHVRWRDVAGFARLVGGRDAVAYRLSGTAGVSTPIGVVDLPLSYSDRLPVPQLPSFGIEGLQVRSASLADVTVDVKLRVTNPNAFPLPAGGLSYSLRIGDSSVASGEGRSVAAVPPNGAGVVAIPVHVSLAGAGRVATQLASGGPVDVGLRGTATFGGLPIPIDVSGRVPAVR
jgi:LEA14-like dessication related protein